MKKLLFSLLTALLFLPAFAQSATFEAGEQIYIDHLTTDDLYTAGGLLSITKDVYGDVIAAGGKIVVQGRVTQDLMAGGGDVIISGEIDDDARILGGNVRIDAAVGGDLLAAGGDISLSDNSFVKGDVYMAGGNLMLSGIVNGDMKLAGGMIYLNTDVEGDVILHRFEKVTFGPNARIQGVLKYRAIQPIDLPQNLAGGGVIFNAIETSQVRENLPAILAGLSFFSLLTTLFFGLIFLWLCRYYILHASHFAYDSTLKTVGVGFLVLLLTPLLTLILLVTVIGVPLGLTLLALWLIFLYMAKVMAAMLIGFKIVKTHEKTTFSRMFGGFVLGVFIYTLIGMVPVIGWVINLIFVMIALGSMTLYEFELFYQLRKKKIV